eukprot:SAG31_NODE_1893_length_6973_cov_5.870963_4_plen_71_part_00
MLANLNGHRCYFEPPEPPPADATPTADEAAAPPAAQHPSYPASDPTGSLPLLLVAKIIVGRQPAGVCNWD